MSEATPIICRRVEDFPTDRDIANYNGGNPTTEANCEKCSKPVFVENGLEENPDPLICIHCADSNAVIFVELPPDEFGCRSLSVTVAQVREKDEGEWHKHGIWHDQRWVLQNQE